MTDKDTQALLERLRQCDGPDLMRAADEAADAIEALTRERDAMAEALREAEQTLSYYLRELGSDYIRNTLLRVRAALTANKPLMDGEV